METNLEKELTILLKRPYGNVVLPKIESLEEFFSGESWKIKNSYSFHFENTVSLSDLKYLKYKVNQVKKKKYHKVLSSCWKVLQMDPCYFWSYLIGGAVCRKYERHLHDVPLFFSCAVLLNPNSATSWHCLQKYYETNEYFSVETFESIFSGLLLTQRDSEKWCCIVSDLLKLSSSICLSRPLKLLVPYVHLSENANIPFLTKAIFSYALENMQRKHRFTDIEIGMDLFKKLSDHNSDVLYIKKILAYTFYSDLSAYFYDLLEHIFCQVNSENDPVSSSFIKKLLVLILYNSPSSQSEIILKIVYRYINKLKIKRKHLLSHNMLILHLFGDSRRACDLYKKIKLKGRTPAIKTRIAGISSLLKLENNEAASKELLKSTLYNNYQNKKCLMSPDMLGKRCTLREKIRRKCHQKMWLRLLTFGPTNAAIKLGVLLCMQNLQREESQDVLFYAAVGCIGLNLNYLAIPFLERLLELGAINEVLFLKALMEDDFQSKTLILKELDEFKLSHKLSAVFSSHYENELKAFKTICKASVMIPDCAFLYEWLGIFFYEKQDFERAEKYFEIALLYNSESWTSINYYSSLIANQNVEASKLFLDLYRSKGLKTFSSRPLVALKAGLMYFKNKCHKNDYFKAAENFRHAMRSSRVKRHFKIMLGESYSLYGMVGVSRKWLSGCYISSDSRNIYAGSQLAKQYLFLKGVSKYANFMRKIFSTSDFSHFLCLYNSAHSFLLKSINVLQKGKQYLSQLYCQNALIMCVRALVVSSHFACTWKLLGDILCQCANLNHFAGFLYVPHWLLPEYSCEKIVCIRRFQSILLGIRCYITALDSLTCTKEFKASLWNSIAVAYTKLNTLSSRVDKKKVLSFALESSIKALEENPKDNFSWNTLGVLLHNGGFSVSQETAQVSLLPLEYSQKLSKHIIFRLIVNSNLAFEHLAIMDFEKAYFKFLAVRGECTAFDFCWIGQIFLNFVFGYEDEVTVDNILFIYSLTHHSPSIKLLFTHLLFLSQHCPESLIRSAGNIYNKCIGVGVSSFSDYILSCILKTEQGYFDEARQDILFALRTCNGLQKNDFSNYNSAVFELHHLLKIHGKQCCLLNIINSNVKNVKQSFSLCGIYLSNGEDGKAFIELMKLLHFETHPFVKKTVNLSLALISFKNKSIGDAKYFLKQAYL